MWLSYFFGVTCQLLRLAPDGAYYVKTQVAFLWKGPSFGHTVEEPVCPVAEDSSAHLCPV